MLSTVLFYGKVQNRKSIIENDFQYGFGINALPIFDGVVRNVIDKHYGNKSGDMIYNIKKDGVDNTRNGYKIKEGHKPKMKFLKYNMIISRHTKHISIIYKKHLIKALS